MVRVNTPSVVGRTKPALGRSFVYALLYSSSVSVTRRGWHAFFFPFVLSDDIRVPLLIIIEVDSDSDSSSSSSDTTNDTCEKNATAAAAVAVHCTILQLQLLVCRRDSEDVRMIGYDMI